MPWASIKGLVLLCVVLGIYLWFRRVSRMMKARQEAVDVAAKQLSEVRADAAVSRTEEVSAVLERSENIYSQAAAMYMQTLEHPLYWLPAAVMGYRPLSEDAALQRSEEEESK